MVDIVLKVGGALMRDSEMFQRALAALGRISAGSRVLVVPGGGPFADVVRDADRTYGLGEDAAHWMAVLAMDQYAHLLASRVTRAILVECLADVETALDDGRLPVLAPYHWLRRDDPLPHSWSVTSDSIAAWVAKTCGAPDLILLKAAEGPVAEVTDPHFPSYSAEQDGAFRICISTVADIESSIAERAALGDRARSQPGHRRGDHFADRV
jgi:aspartokinase-like uncharacterized kinase